uniref:Uncharacterized protein n=1 Tax=Panagrolaimus sp. ES5 TaxID=591445 RepID=A0AC34GD16_9BILA
MCRSKGVNGVKSGSQRYSNHRYRNRQNLIQNTSDDEDTQESSYAHKQHTVTIPGNFCFDVLSLQSEPHWDIPPPTLIDVKVNGYTVTFQHDSGAAAATVQDFNSANAEMKKLKLPDKLEHARKELQKVNDSILEIMECKGNIPVQKYKALEYFQDKMKTFAKQYQDILDRKQAIRDTSFQLLEKLRKDYCSYKDASS